MKDFFSPDFPFAPKKCPFFYGWVIVVVSTIGVVMSVPGQTIGVSVFTDYLIEELGLTRIHLSIAYMFGTIISSLFMPWGGRLFDRYGARFMVVLSSMLLGITLLYLSLCDKIAQAFTLGMDGRLAYLISVVVVFIGFTLLRFSGQGLLTLTGRAMLGKWFNRRRGLVSGINGVVVTFSFSIAPLVFNKLVLMSSWRQAWLYMAISLVGMAFLGWLTFRDHPEECGLQMDGGEVKGVTKKRRAFVDVSKEFTLQEARKTYTFWVFNLGLASQSLIITALTFHIVSIGEQGGLDREKALAIFLPMSFVSIFSNFIFGWVCDYFKLKFTLLVMLLMLALGVYGVNLIDQVYGRAFVIIGFGASGGIFGPLMTVVWPKFYGREYLGAISSLNLSTMVFASAIGPYIFGLSYEYTNSYQAGVYVCLAMPLTTMLFAFFAENPQEAFVQET